jgi:hypothetical protein
VVAAITIVLQAKGVIMVFFQYLKNVVVRVYTIAYPLIA